MKTLFGMLLASGLGLALAISPVSAETETAETDAAATEAAGDKSAKDCPRGKRGEDARYGKHEGGKLWRHGRHGHHDRAAMAAARLAYAKTAIGITDEQMPAWEKYEEIARANMEKIVDESKEMREKMREGSAIDRMQARLAMMEERVEAMKQGLPVAEELYKTLTTEQQKKADRLLALGLGTRTGFHGERYRGHGGERHRGHGGGGDDRNDNL
jgi:hypothetical protein